MYWRPVSNGDRLCLHLTFQTLLQTTSTPNLRLLPMASISAIRKSLILLSAKLFGDRVKFPSTYREFCFKFSILTSITVLCCFGFNASYFDWLVAILILNALLIICRHVTDCTGNNLGSNFQSNEDEKEERTSARYGQKQKQNKQQQKLHFTTSSYRHI